MPQANNVLLFYKPPYLYPCPNPSLTLYMTLSPPPPHTHEGGTISGTRPKYFCILPRGLLHFWALAEASLHGLFDETLFTFIVTCACWRGCLSLVNIFTRVVHSGGQPCMGIHRHYRTLSLESVLRRTRDLAIHCQSRLPHL